MSDGVIPSKTLLSVSDAEAYALADEISALKKQLAQAEQDLDGFKDLASQSDLKAAALRLTLNQTATRALNAETDRAEVLLVMAKVRTALPEDSFERATITHLMQKAGMPT